jgi:hypothetical protein
MSQTPHSPSLSEAQLAKLTEIGEERTANAGDVLYRVGDRDYPFVAIIDGEVAILDAAGNEIARHGASKSLGEVNLLSGQSLFVTALAREPLRYIAVERDALRSLLFDDGPLSDLLLATFIARREAMQQVGDLGLEILGPRSSPATLRLLEFARSNRLPLTWRDPDSLGDWSGRAPTRPILGSDGHRALWVVPPAIFKSWTARDRKEPHDKRRVRPPGIRHSRGQGHRGVGRLLQPGRGVRRRIGWSDLPRAQRSWKAR